MDPKSRGPKVPWSQSHMVPTGMEKDVMLSPSNRGFHKILAIFCVMIRQNIPPSHMFECLNTLLMVLVHFIYLCTFVCSFECFSAESILRIFRIFRDRQDCHFFHDWVPKSHAPKVQWSQRPMFPKSQDPKFLWSQNSMDPNFHGPKVPWSQRLMVLKSHGQKFPGSQGTIQGVPQELTKRIVLLHRPGSIPGPIIRGKSSLNLGLFDIP